MSRIPISTPSGEIIRHYDVNATDEETVFFHLVDTSHEFVMGLKDILKCVKMAEKQGLIPELPGSWWDMISEDYIDFREYHEPPKDEEEMEE